MIATLTLDRMHAVKEATFIVQFEDTISLDAQLISIEVLNGESKNDVKPFSIILQTDQINQYYKQGTYLVKNKEIGEHYLFMVPIGSDYKGTRYEVIFN